MSLFPTCWLVRLSRCGLFPPDALGVRVRRRSLCAAAGAKLEVRVATPVHTKPVKLNNSQKQMEQPKT